MTGIKDMPVMFSTGNENHLISRFLPANSVAALDQHVSYEVRLAAGIDKDNKFLFSSTTLLAHISSGHAMHTAVEQVGLKKEQLEFLNATNQIC